MPNMPLLPKQPEPVAWRFDGEVAKGVAVTVYKSVANSWIARGYKATPLFELATTQPVIPEQLTVRMAEDKALSLGAVLYDEEADVFADGWNACRAEMLKAQQNEAQNIPENIPEKPIGEHKWISVDERMPDNYAPVLVCSNRGIIWCAEVEDGDFYPDEFPNLPREGFEITHWMPLPEAPAQESDND